jgi:hypothetical protein
MRTPCDRLTCVSGKSLEWAPGRWPSQIIYSLSVQGSLGARLMGMNTRYFYDSQEQEA